MGEKDHQLVFGQVRQLQGDIRRQGIHMLAQSPTEKCEERIRPWGN